MACSFLALKWSYYKWILGFHCVTAAEEIAVKIILFAACLISVLIIPVCMFLLAIVLVRIVLDTLLQLLKYI